MSDYAKRGGRGANRKGRSRNRPRFAMHYHYLLDCPAYRDLRPLARGAYMLLKRRFNGSNNGHINCSIRDLTKELHCGKDSARAALKELVEHGFIRQAQPGSFNYKIPHSPSWILTEEALDDTLATKDFMRWELKRKKPVPG